MELFYTTLRATTFSNAIRQSNLLLKTLRELDRCNYWQDLKSVARTGWQLKGIPNPESVAEHSIKVAELAVRLSRNRNLDLNKLIEMSLVHDLPEIRVNDLTPHDPVELDKKHLQEEAAMQALMAKLGLPKGPHYLSLFQEYNQGQTPEAFFLKQIDKLEMVGTALEYEIKHPDKADGLVEFWLYTRQRLTDPLLIDYFDQLALQRSAVRSRFCEPDFRKKPL
jgi:5'-deoxynucleotidase YfbR-like HD superfamily hydrolase